MTWVDDRHRTVSRQVTCRSTHICNGCGEPIAPGVEHLDHELYRDPATPVGAWVELLDVVYECLPCAARNGRPGVAEPDVPEQPLIPDGVA